MSITVSHLHHILFGGDQLTVAWASGAIRHRQNFETAMGRMEGLIPVGED